MVVKMGRNDLHQAREHGSRVAARDVRLWGLDNSCLVYPVSLHRYMTASGLNFVSDALWKHRSCSGMLVNGNVIVSGGLSPIETRFTVAHEIGHHRLGTTHGVASDPLIEAEADGYAGGLLMPEVVLEKLFWRRGITLGMPFTPRDLVYIRSVLVAVARGTDRKPHLKVSVETLLLAMADAGLIDGEEPFECHYRLLDFWRRSSAAPRTGSQG